VDIFQVKEIPFKTFRRKIPIGDVALSGKGLKILKFLWSDDSMQPGGRMAREVGGLEGEGGFIEVITELLILGIVSQPRSHGSITQ